jgi:hypothetical protein
MGRCIWLHHLDLEDDDDDWKGAEVPAGTTVTETQPLIRLCFLCCLLFKFSFAAFS